MQIFSNFAPAIVVNLLKLKTLSLDDLDLSLKVDVDEDDYLSFLAILCWPQHLLDEVEML